MFWLQAPAPASGGLSGDVIRGLAGGALGLVASLITLLAGWLKDRDDSSRRVKEIDEATKIVNFWKLWFEASEKLMPSIESSDKDMAISQISIASHRIETIVASNREMQKSAVIQTTELDSRKRGLPVWRRILLLYMPPRARAWIPRLLFYVYIVAPVFEVFSDDNDRSSMLLGSGIIAVAAWFASIWLERPGKTH